MAEVVDAIIADLIVRNLDRYEADMARVVKAHEGVLQSAKGLATADPGQAIGGYATKHSQASAAIVEATKRRTDAEKAAAKATADAVKAEQRAKEAAEKATAKDAAAAQRAADMKAAAAKRAADAVVAAAEREQAAHVRLAAVVARSAASGGVKPGSGRIASTSVPGENKTGQGTIPLSTLNGTDTAAAAAGVAAEAEAVKEVNHLRADTFDLEQKVKAARGSQKIELQEELEYLRRINTYKAAGLTEDEATLRAQREMVAVGALRANSARSGPGKGLARFAEGAGLGRTGGGLAAIGGIGVALAVGATVEGVKQGVAFGNEIGDTATALGLTTKQLQVYRAAAQEAGATTDQVRTAFAQFNNELGRAKEGDKAVGKVFAELKIDPKQFQSISDALPAVSDQLSKIEDPARRAALGTKLFGESYSRLDAVISSGSASLNTYADGLERAGSILSAADIANLREADRVFGRINNELQVDLARAVSSNKGAILELASAFGQLAAKALEALATIGRIRAQNQYSGAVPGSNAQREAYDTLIQDPKGRTFLKGAMRKRLDDVINAPAMIVNGKPDPVARDKYRMQRGHEILNEMRLVYNYKTPPEDMPTPPTLPPPGPPGAFAPSPPKGKSAAELAAEAEERTKRFKDRIASLQEQELRGQENLTGSIDTRANIEIDLAKRALTKQLDDIESDRKANILKGADAALENARAKQASAAAKAANKADVAVINWQRQADLSSAQVDHLRTQLSIETDMLNEQMGLAVTTKERRALALRLLDLQKQDEKAALQQQRSRLKPGDPGIADIDQRLGSLDAIYDQRRQQSKVDNASPLDAYRRQLKSAVGDTDEALQRVEVNAMQRLEDQLASTLTKVLGLKGAFGELFGSILADLAKIEIEKGILSILGDAPGDGGASKGGFGGIFSAIAGLFGGGGGGLGGVNGTGVIMENPFTTPGFATGVTGVFGGRDGVDANMVSINGKPSFRVNKGEQFAIGPNIGPVNGRVSSPGPAPVMLHQTVNIDASGVNPEGYTKGILGIVRRETTNAIQQSNRQVLEAVPGTISRAQTLKG